MKIAYIQPGDGSRYMAGVAQVVMDDAQRPEIWFAFGRADQHLAMYPLAARGDAPDDFHYFRRHWASAVDDNLWELWVGLMILRHLLGRPTHWPTLPPQLVRTARAAFEAQGQPWDILADRAWDRDWQHQLHDLRRHVMQLIAAAGGAPESPDAPETYQN